MSQTPEKQQAANIKHGSDSEHGPFLEWKYKLNKKTGEAEFDSVQLSHGSKINVENFEKALKNATGTFQPCDCGKNSKKGCSRPFC